MGPRRRGIVIAHIREPVVGRVRPRIARRVLTPLGVPSGGRAPADAAMAHRGTAAALAAQPKEIAGRIIGIALAVERGQRRRVVLPRRAVRARAVAAGRRLVPRTRQRNGVAGAPRGALEPPERIVAEAADQRVAGGKLRGELRIDAAERIGIVEDAAARRAVGKREDVAVEILRIAEVLQRMIGIGRTVDVRRRSRAALAAQAHQAGAARVVGIAADHAVAVHDQRALAARIMGDALDIGRVVEPHALKATGAVVARLQHAAHAVRVGRIEQAPQPAERVILRGGLLGSVEQRLGVCIERHARRRLPVHAERRGAPARSWRRRRTDNARRDGRLGGAQASRWRLGSRE